MALSRRSLKPSVAGSWWEHPPAFLDDWLLGAFLIAGAWVTRDPRAARGRTVLAAAWGFACGMAYSSATFHWFAMRAGQIDPAPIPSQWVFAIKIGGGLLFVAALALTLTGNQSAASERSTSGSHPE